MAIIQHWQQINIRKLCLHLIIGVIAAGSGLTVYLRVVPQNETLIFSSSLFISNLRQVNKDNTLPITKKITHPVMKLSGAHLRYNTIFQTHFMVNAFFEGLWVAVQKGIRAGPSFA